MGQWIERTEPNDLIIDYNDWLMYLPSGINRTTHGV
jgi:hypothetical protein